MNALNRAGTLPLSAIDTVCDEPGTLPLSAIDTVCDEPPSSGMRVDAREFGGTITSTAQNIRFVVSLCMAKKAITDCIELPRQARDNHKEDVQTRTIESHLWAWCSA
jgi:hypothetical protein